jgi:uncharacterized HAD superfamily protein
METTGKTIEQQITEIKALCYDSLAIIELHQKRLQDCNTQLCKLYEELNKPKDTI